MLPTVGSLPAGLLMSMAGEAITKSLTPDTVEMACQMWAIGIEAARGLPSRKNTSAIAAGTPARAALGMPSIAKAIGLATGVQT